MLERSVAAVGLALFSPLLLVLLAFVRLNSRGDALFWQERVGFGGQRFWMCKLRSMTVDAEEWTGAVWAMENDPRVTPIGRFLRKTHLDELPQLWNIACGQMSFVGPRPERPEIVEELTKEIPGYEHRLAVLPGVTGLAQVNLLPDQTVDCVRQKIELDLEYIYTAEPSLDLRVLACTSLKMIGTPYAVATRLFCVNRTPSLAKLALPNKALGADSFDGSATSNSKASNSKASNSKASNSKASNSLASDSRSTSRDSSNDLELPLVETQSKLTFGTIPADVA